MFLGWCFCVYLRVRGCVWLYFVWEAQHDVKIQLSSSWKCIFLAG